MLACLRQPSCLPRSPMPCGVRRSHTSGFLLQLKSRKGSCHRVSLDCAGQCCDCPSHPWMLSSLHDMLFIINISWIGLAPGEFTASSLMVLGCDWPVPLEPSTELGRRSSGWAPLSRRRSLAPRLFLRLPIWTISCGLQHYLVHFMW